MSFSKIPHIKPRRQVFFLLIIEIAFRRKGKVYILVIYEKPNGHIMENLFVASVFWSFFFRKGYSCKMDVHYKFLRKYFR